MPSTATLTVVLFILLDVIGCTVGSKGISDILLGREEADEDYTATGAYNPMKEKCCLGVLHANPKRELEKCCGSALIDVTKQLCCNGTVHEYTVPSACCGQQAYDTDHAKCCQGLVVPMDPEAKATSECCGPAIADSRTSVCCPSDKGMVVLDNGNGQKNYCCDDKTFDIETEVCCAELIGDRDISFSVVPKDGDKIMCCGNKLYDDVTETCCGFEIVPASVACCGGQLLNETEICCWNGDNTFSPKVPPTPQHDCCGSSGFYDSRTQLCCGSTVFDNPGNSVRCCGADKTFDLNSDLCCPQMGGAYEVVKKTSSGQDGCCGHTPYNQTTDFCCNIKSGKVATKLSPQADTCCGDTAYRFSEGICCDNKPFAGPWYMLMCCNGTGFNTTESICCGGKLKKHEKGDKCCGDSEIFNSSTHRCCIDYLQNPPAVAVVEAENESQSCCGLNLYNPAAGFCCGNEVLPHNSGKSCCARQQLDEKEQICCGMTILPRKEEETACCYSFTTDEFVSYITP